jgi:hypothetical protein
MTSILIADPADGPVAQASLYRAYRLAWAGRK